MTGKREGARDHYRFRRPQRKTTRATSAVLRQIFDVIMPAKHLTISEMAHNRGMTRVGFAFWKSGRTTPRIDDVELLARDLGYELKLVPLGGRRSVEEILAELKEALLDG